MNEQVTDGPRPPDSVPSPPEQRVNRLVPFVHVEDVERSIAFYYHLGFIVASVYKYKGRHLSHQGPALLRWALFEAAQCAARRSSPDHAYYLQVAQRIDHNRACLSVARKLCRRAHHILRQLGDDALAPTAPPDQNTARRRCRLSDPRARARHHTDALAASSRNAPAATAHRPGRPP
jgi:hypothetical protein